MLRIIVSSFAVLVITSSVRATAVQWPVNQGGNGHYYDWVAGYLTESNAQSAASAMTFDGVHGYLATITSPAEDTFFESQFSQNSGQTLIGWLGGYQDHSAPDYSEPAGGWRWITGETWNFTDWWTAKGFPDNAGSGQDFLRTQPVGGDIFWDDIENDPGSLEIGGYFVEYPVPEPAAGFSLAVVSVLLLGIRLPRGTWTRA